MRELSQPAVETIDAADVRGEWDEILEKVRRGQARILIERDGQPAAAVVSADDLEQLKLLDARRNEALRVLESSQAAFAGEPPERVEAEIGRAVASVRRDNRRRRVKHTP